jgi:RNA polymerase sigma-70 factor (ECF subfamily)
MANDSPTPETRPSLIQRVSALDPESWNEFIALYDPLLAAYVGDCNRRYQLSLDAHDREEIKQEVLIKLFHELASFDPRRRFRTWLWRVTHNAVIDWLRGQRRRRGPGDGAAAQAGGPRPQNLHWTPELEDALASDENPPDEQLIQEHLWHVRRHILEKVKVEMGSAHKWDCFERHFLQCKPSAEVAGELGLTISVVNTNTFRVRARIRELCQDYDAEL